MPQHCAAVMSPAEVTYFEGYDELVEAYGEEVDCDLMEYGGGVVCGDGVPGGSQGAMVEVRVVKKGGAGEIVTEEGGTVVLEEGSTHFLRRGDVERLVRGGELEQV